MRAGASSMSRRPTAAIAGWLSRRDAFPLAIRATLRYYAKTGLFDRQSIRIKSYVDETIEAILDDAFREIEREIAAEFDRESVAFEYETKLTLPAELTLGYLYRRVLAEAPPAFNPITRTATTGGLESVRARLDPNWQRRRTERLLDANRDLVERVEGIDAVTRLIVEALIDGDLRDALNDDEYGDVVVDFEVRDPAERRRVATIAQRTLQESIEARLAEMPEAVGDAYRAAVDVSERHQDQDETFRGYLGEDGSGELIRTEYKFAAFDSPPAFLDEELFELPYFKTQFDRVGVIYDGMVEMYRGAGFRIGQDFKRAIVLSIIGAQIWLDDVSDFAEDRAEGQLTPVTAEYELAETDSAAYQEVIDISERYLERARRYATDAGTPMMGIAIEYIYLLGEPGHLPR